MYLKNPTVYFGRLVSAAIGLIIWHFAYIRFIVPLGNILSNRFFDENSNDFLVNFLKDCHSKKGFGVHDNFVNYSIPGVLFASAAREKKRNLYNVLGVRKNATEREIDKAYRRLAKELHPDVNPGKEAEFMEVAKAHEILSNPEERKKYDLYGEMPEGAQNFQGFDGGFNFDILSNLFEGGGFGGFQGGFPGGGRGHGGPRMHFNFQQSNHHDSSSGFKVFNDDEEDIEANLYEKVEFVTELSQASFERDVLGREGFYVIEAYSPKCLPCRDFKPEYSTAADILEGFIPFGAMNCNRHRSSSFCRTVRKYPTIFVYGLDKSRPPIEYTGPKKYEELHKFIAKQIPKSYTELNKYNMESWLTSPKTKAIFFSSTKPPYLIFTVIARELKNQIDLGVIYETDDPLISSYFLKPNELNSGIATKSIKFPSILKIIDIDTLQGEWFRASSSNIQQINLVFSKIISSSRILKKTLNRLTPRRVKSGDCAKSDSQFCFFLILPNAHNIVGTAHDNFQALKSIAEKLTSDPAKFYYIDASKYKTVANAFGYRTSETTDSWLVGYRPKRGKYKVLEKASPSTMDTFINNVLTGSQLDKKYTGNLIDLFNDKGYRKSANHDEL